MRALTADIQIGPLQLRHATGVSIESSWRLMGDRATVTLPRKVSLRGSKLEELFKPGQPATVSVGYDGNADVTFEGVVSKVSPDTPLVIQLEDGFHALRRKTVTGSYGSVTLAQLLSDILPGQKVYALEMSLGKFRFDQVTVARLLLELQKNYGIYSWFNAGVLHAGFAYAAGAGTDVSADFQRNVSSSNLSFATVEDRKIKVKATSFKSDGQVVTIELGDGDGDQRSLHYYGLGEAELRKVANGEMARLKYAGWEGDLEVFGDAGARHGDVAVLKDAFNADRNGRYFIDQVTTNWGLTGFRQVLKLGKKA